MRKEKASGVAIAARYASGLSDGGGGARYALLWVMSTHQNPYAMHDHAGLRWLAGFGSVFVLTILAAFAMMLYPHLIR